MITIVHNFCEIPSFFVLFSFVLFYSSLQNDNDEWIFVWLGGDSKTLMFVQISPNENDLGETLCSLNFGSRVRGIELGPAQRLLDTAELLRYKQMVLEFSYFYASLSSFYEVCLRKILTLLLPRLKNKNKIWRPKIYSSRRWRKQSMDWSWRWKKKISEIRIFKRR